jgi:hypothetical protein
VKKKTRERGRSFHSHSLFVIASNVCTVGFRIHCDMALLIHVLYRWTISHQRTTDAKTPRVTKIRRLRRES